MLMDGVSDSSYYWLSCMTFVRFPYQCSDTLNVCYANFKCCLIIVNLKLSLQLCSIYPPPPQQLFVQETVGHPEDPSFVQCIDYRFKNNNRICWILYHFFVTLYIYVVPLVVIITCYSVIVYTIYSKGKKFCGE